MAVNLFLLQRLKCIYLSVVYLMMLSVALSCPSDRIWKLHGNRNLKPPHYEAASSTMIPGLMVQLYASSTQSKMGSI
jgi:hypothetical protein